VSDLFAYIATRTTVDPYVPSGVTNMQILARDVSDAFVAISSGYMTVGELRFFPIQRTVPGHLLCDGREVSKTSFPELYRYLGDTQGTPADAGNFVLPSFIGAASFDPAPVAETETVIDGTVYTDPPAVPPTDFFVDEFLRQWDSAGRPPIPPPY
jgi:hypothetical protein